MRWPQCVVLESFRLISNISTSVLTCVVFFVSALDLCKRWFRMGLHRSFFPPVWCRKDCWHDLPRRGSCQSRTPCLYKVFSRSAWRYVSVRMAWLISSKYQVRLHTGADYWCVRVICLDLYSSLAEAGNLHLRANLPSDHSQANCPIVRCWESAIFECL